ncbi:cyclic AMP-dependent transcription factor ATF-7a isoform X2 [Alosa sapidissima]|uniref:cyclic AMP-dependent transcription factor ATF-7a isoform X2 n=1 Tax=Alosa sapidissima TaxID=34773 RepID=UPI001C089DF0|nr:cyclic AMP-dependent transcription factor ATF-7a isoform X2 [Alosa sapidissima]
MGDDRPFVCNAPGCGQRFTNEDHLAVHKHKHEMTLKFGPARTDSVIIADQTPTPTRFLKNCEEVGLFNELASSFEQEFRKAQEDDDKRAKNPALSSASTGVLDMSLQTPSEVKVKEEEPVEVDSSPPGSPESISSRSDSENEYVGRPKDTPPRPPVSAAPTPTIVRPGSLPLHLGYDALHPTMPSPTSVITQAPPSNRQLGSPTGPYPMMMLPNGQTVPVLPGPMQMPSVISLARPLMVPNIPGIPGPPLGGSSSGSSSPSGYNPHSEAKMVSPAQPTGGRRRRAADDDPDERRQRFLERNRAAASRCRQKRKVWVNSLEKKAEELTSLNVSLSNEVTLLRNEVAHLKQLLLAHKDCPVTTLQKKNAYLGDETMKDVSEPVGSPAAVIQHSSLAPSPSSAGPNGLSARAAAEAVAMSVLAGMGSHRGEQGHGAGGPSHVIMATQSQPSTR